MLNTSDKNVTVIKKSDLWDQEYLIFPKLKNKRKTELVRNPNLKFYATELTEAHDNINNMYCITAPAFYVLINERDDLFITEMIKDNQVNPLLADKLNSFMEEAFGKYPNSSEDAINHLNDVLLKNFLEEAKKGSPILAVIY